MNTQKNTFVRRKDIPSQTLLELYQKSAYLCNICRRVGYRVEVAHIYGYNEGKSPRTVPEKIHNHSYDNLILLCKSCHYDVDFGYKSSISADELKAIKKAHEDWVHNCFNPNNTNQNFIISINRTFDFNGIKNACFQSTGTLIHTKVSDLSELIECLREYSPINYPFGYQELDECMKLIIAQYEVLNKDIHRHFDLNINTGYFNMKIESKKELGFNSNLGVIEIESRLSQLYDLLNNWLCLSKKYNLL